MSDFVKLHRHFSHSAIDNLFKMAKTSCSDGTHPGTNRSLDKIAKTCDTCQNFEHSSIRFVSIPNANDLKFCDDISFDLMFFDGKEILHVFDTSTYLSEATFLDAHKKNLRYKLWNFFG